MLNAKAKIVNEKLKILRKANKVSQMEVASVLGIDAANISRAEHNKYQFTPASINKLADFYKVTPESMYKRATVEELYALDIMKEEKERASKRASAKRIYAENKAVELEVRV